VLPRLPAIRRFIVIRNRRSASVDESNLDPPSAVHSARLDLDPDRRQPVDRTAHARSETYVRGVLPIIFFKHQWQREISPSQLPQLSGHSVAGPPARHVNSPRNRSRISALISRSWIGARFQYERRPFRRELSGRSNHTQKHHRGATRTHVSVERIAPSIGIPVRIRPGSSCKRGNAQVRYRSGRLLLGGKRTMSRKI
jgi:hypothetical protein